MYLPLRSGKICHAFSQKFVQTASDQNQQFVVGLVSGSLLDSVHCAHERDFDPFNSVFAGISASGVAGHLGCQNRSARELHPRAPRRSDHGKPVPCSGGCHTEAEKDPPQGASRFSRLSRTGSLSTPLHREFRQLVRLCQCLPVRHGRLAAVSAQWRSEPGVKPLDRPTW